MTEHLHDLLPGAGVPTTALLSAGVARRGSNGRTSWNDPGGATHHAVALGMKVAGEQHAFGSAFQDL